MQGNLLALACALLLATVPGMVHAGGSVEFLNSGEVLPTGLPFSEAVRVGDVLYLSGQIGVQPGSLKLVPGGIRAEARQTMENIKTTLQVHGYRLQDLVKCTVMLADIAEWGSFNEVYKSFFSPPYPARSAFAASGAGVPAGPGIGPKQAAVWYVTKPSNCARSWQSTPVRTRRIRQSAR